MNMNLQTFWGFLAVALSNQINIPRLVYLFHSHHLMQQKILHLHIKVVSVLLFTLTKNTASPVVPMGRKAVPGLRDSGPK